MKSHALAASAALVLSTALLAQAVGETPTPPTIPGEAPSQVVFNPQNAPGTVPAAARTTWGNTNNNIPFSWTPTRYQQVFLGSELPTSLVMRGLGLRFDEAFSNFKGQTIDIEIKLGYSTKTSATMSTTFAQNFDVTTPAPVTVFPRAKFQLPDMPAAKPTNPQNWPIQFSFAKPFIWIKNANRNLCIEVVIYGNSNNNALFTYPLDAISGTGATTSRVYASGNPTATSGSKGTGYGIVMSFLDKVKVSSSYAAFGTGCPGTGGTPVIAMPSAAATTMGNSNNYYGVSRSNMRYQQIYDGSKIGSARVFRGHSLRMRAATYAGGTQTIEIKLSETKVSPATASATFASNITSAAHTTVFKGTYNYPPMVSNNDPSSWKIPFKYSVPFVWRGQGNLLMEHINTSTSNLSYFVDAFSGNAEVTRIYSTASATATTGTVGTNYGLSTGFQYAGGGNAVPVLGNTGLPIVGKSFSVDLSQAKASGAAALIMGFSNSSWGAIRLPFTLLPTKCNLLVSPDLFFSTTTDSSGAGSVKFTLPNVSALSGVKFYNQYMVFDAQANGWGLAFSNGGAALIGEQ